MKREINAAREALGLSQVDLAILLKVNRSQLAMSEVFQRNLPSKASLLLTEMILHCTEKGEDEQAVKRSNPRLNDIERKRLDGALADNKIRQIKLSKAIGRLEKKQEVQRKQQRVVGFLEKRAAAVGLERIKYVISVAELSFTNEEASALAKCLESQKLLQFEQQMLESALRRLDENEK